MQLRILELSGTRRQMGRAHGEALKAIIQADAAASVARLAQTMRATTDAALAAVQARHLPMFEQLVPHIVEEIRGIAEGAGVSFATVFFMNARHGVGPWPAEAGCTAFAAGRGTVAGGGVLAGQNKDTPAANMERMLVVKTRPKGGGGFTAMTYAGEIGHIGLGVNGVASFANSLYVQGTGAGGCHNLARLCMLEAKSVDDCERMLRRLPAWAPANYPAADAAGNVACFEMAGTKWRRVTPRDGLICHANHIHHPDLLPLENYPERAAQSEAREARMDALLREKLGAITPEDCARALRDHACGAHSICRHGTPIGGTVCQTTFSIFADLKERVVYALLGNPCGGEYVQIAVD